MVNGRLERKTLTAYLRELLEERLEREPSYVWNAVSEAAAVLAASELTPAVEKVYEEGLTDGIFISPEQALRGLAKDVDAAIDTLRGTPHMR